MPAKESIRGRTRTPRDESTISSRSTRKKKKGEFEDCNVIDRVPTAYDYQSDSSEDGWLEEKSKGSRYSANKDDARNQSLLSDGDEEEAEGVEEVRDDVVEKPEPDHDKYSNTHLLDAKIEWLFSEDGDTKRYASKAYLGSLMGTGDNFESSKQSKKKKKPVVIPVEEDEEVMEPIYESPQKNMIKTNQFKFKDKKLAVPPIGGVAPVLAKKPTDEVSTAQEFGSVASSLTDPLEQMLRNSENPDKMVAEFEEKLRQLKAIAAASKMVNEGGRSPIYERNGLENKASSRGTSNSKKSSSSRTSRSQSRTGRSKSASPSSKRSGRSKSNQSHKSSRSKSSHRSNKSSRSKSSRSKARKEKSTQSSKKISRSKRLPDLIGSPSDAVYSNAATKKRSNAKYKNKNENIIKSPCSKEKKIDETSKKSSSSSRKKSRSHSADQHRSRSHSRSRSVSSKATGRSKSSSKRHEVKKKHKKHSSKSPSNRSKQRTSISTERSRSGSKTRRGSKTRNGSKTRHRSKKSSSTKFKGSKYINDHDVKDECVERARYELTREMIHLLEKVSHAKTQDESDSSATSSKKSSRTKQTGVVKKRKDVMKNFASFFRRTKRQEEITIARTEDNDDYRKINKNGSEPVTINTRSMTTDDDREGDLPESPRSSHEDVSLAFAERQEMLENIIVNSNAITTNSPEKSSPLGKNREKESLEDKNSRNSPSKSSPLGELRKKESGPSKSSPLGELRKKESVVYIIEAGKEAKTVEEKNLNVRMKRTESKESPERSKFADRWKTEIQSSEDKWLLEKIAAQEKKAARKKVSKEKTRLSEEKKGAETSYVDDDVKSRTATIKKTAAEKKKRRKEIERERECEKDIETDIEKEKRKKGKKERKKSKKGKEENKKKDQKKALEEENKSEWDNVSDKVVKALATTDEVALKPYPTLSYKSKERNLGDSASKASKASKGTYAATKVPAHLVTMLNPLDLDEYSVTFPSTEPGLVQCLRFYSCGSAASAVNVAIQVSECDQCDPHDPIRITNSDYDDAILDSRSIAESSKKSYPPPTSPMQTVEVVLEDEDQSKPSIFTRIRTVERGMPVSGDDDDESTDDGYYLKEAPTLKLPHVNSYVLDVSRMQLHLDEDSVELQTREASRRSTGTAEDRTTISITSILIPPKRLNSEDESETEEEEDNENEEDAVHASADTPSEAERIKVGDLHTDTEDESKVKKKRNRVLRVFSRFRKRERANKGLYEA